MEQKLRECFADMIVYKEPQRSQSFSALSIPSYMRDWIVMRYADADGAVNMDEALHFVHEKLPRRDDWDTMLHRMVHRNEEVVFLARVNVQTDVSDRVTYFSLPDFGFPRRKKEAVVHDVVLQKVGETLSSSANVWGIVTLICGDVDDVKSAIIMVDFKAFCPYRVDLGYFQEARRQFTTKEWLDVVLSAIDYNPTGYIDGQQRLTTISRLLPFVEKRINLIELAPKSTGKSYMFSRISKYGWLVSGGSITRAKLFYDIGSKTEGLISRFDYVALDEIQSIVFPNESEIQGALKGYLESGEFRVGPYSGNADAGFVLLGNIDERNMCADMPMFSDLPAIFGESALLDRFHGFIQGWDIPRMRENLAAHGWALNVEYFSEILHALREDVHYRSLVDDLIDVPGDADKRDTEAVKRISTGFLKLLFPHVNSIEDINLAEFQEWCLNPAIKMRSIIKGQMALIDTEFVGKEMPRLTIKGDRN